MNTSYQVEKPLNNLPDENAFGEVFVPRQKMIDAMATLGLEIEDATGRNHSSAIRFCGTVDGIEVTVSGNAVCQLTNREWDLAERGLLPWRVQRIPPFDSNRWGYLQTYNPSQNKAVTHFKLHAWIPTSTNLKGKGRDGKAWQIYHAIYNALTR